MCRTIHIKCYPHITLLTELKRLGVAEVYKYFTPNGVKRLARRLVLSVCFGPRRIFGRLSSSVPIQFRNRRKHISHLRQDCVFELRRVGDEGVEGGDAANGSVEVREQLIRNARGDLRAIAP